MAEGAAVPTGAAVAVVTPLRTTRMLRSPYVTSTSDKPVSSNSLASSRIWLQSTVGFAMSALNLAFAQNVFYCIQR